MQSLGGIETYQTRYLYIQLLNIVECDSFDAVSGTDANKEVISKAQSDKLFLIAKGKDTDKVKAIINKHGFSKSKDITKAKYNDICKEVEALEVTAKAWTDVDVKLIKNLCDKHNAQTSNEYERKWIAREKRFLRSLMEDE